MKKGQRVKCINDKALSDTGVKPPLELNEEYTILQITLDNKNNQHLDVGLISKFNYVSSLETKEVLDDSGVDGIHWCHPSRFKEL
tara:strand:- start:30451 stop:30705 length:255 start_codon:yes stop_codon:yes gene_type:complete